MSQMYLPIGETMQIRLPGMAGRHHLSKRTDMICGRHIAHHDDAMTISGRVSTAVVQRFCKPKVGGSNPSPGTIPRLSSLET